MKKLLQLAAICAIIGGITTLVLVLIKVPPATTFDERLLLQHNSAYLARLWIFFFHPQLNVLAALGITAALFRRSPHLVVPGFLFIAIWGVTEAAQQAFSIDAINLYWRAGYSTATDEAMKSALYSNLIGADAVRDSMYFLLVYCFGMGALFMGIALLREELMAKISGVGFIFFGILSLAAFADYYGGASFLDPAVNFGFDWVYPWLQPITRSLSGIWLWRQAVQGADVPELPLRSAPV